MITVGPLSFRNKTALSNYARDLLHGSPEDAPLHDDHDFLLAFLARHYDAADKIGPGVRHFVVRRHKVKDNARWEDGFHAVREDGQEISFSYKKCVDGAAPGYEDKLAQAGRACVASSMFETRLLYFDEKSEAPCEVCGKLTPFADTAVDHHEPKFRQIVEAWGREYIVFDKGPAGHVFASRIDSLDFLWHHNSMVKVLRVLCRRCNGAAK